jgi:hypothetical protein
MENAYNSNTLSLENYLLRVEQPPVLTAPIVHEPNGEARRYLQTRTRPSETRTCCNGESEAEVPTRFLKIRSSHGKGQRSYGGRVGDLDFAPRGRARPVVDPVDPAAVAQRHGLSHELLADAKRPRRFGPHAAGGTAGSCQGPGGGGGGGGGSGTEKRGGSRRGSEGGVYECAMVAGGEQQKRRDEDEGAA